MYNPFQKPLDKIEEEDLKTMLGGNVETWGFEYKGPKTIHDNAAIAKSIASFANKYGGWLFIGICADKQTNEPQLDDIPGVPQRDELTESIYRIAHSHLSPAPYLACHAVQLANGNSVIAAYVPPSHNPPHVHVGTGRVFVRSGNVTDPIDRIGKRAELDELYERARDNRERLRDLLAVHERGALFLRIVTGHCEEAARAVRPEAPSPAFAAYSLVSYPMMVSPRLFAFPPYFPPLTRCLETVRQQGDPATVDVFLDGLRRAVKQRWHDQHRVHMVSDESELFYMDAFGHIGFAGPASRENYPRLGGAAVHKCTTHLEAFAEGCRILYREADYWGDIGLNCRIQLPDRGILPPTETVSSAADIAQALDVKEVGLELSRLAGLEDQ